MGCSPRPSRIPIMQPRSWNLALVLTLTVGVTGCGRGETPLDGPTTTSLTLEEYAVQLVEATNQARAELGLDELEWSDCAAQEGRKRAADLIGRDLEHAPLNGVLEACDAAKAAENLVNSSANPAEVVEAWMASPGHRNNIVDPELTEIGIGCVEDGEKVLCSQLFLDG